MAHLEKYKASSVGHMLAHYRRDPSSLGRENIDPERVGMDYTLGVDPADGLVKPMEGVEPNWATVEGRIERVNERAKAEGKRAVRKDAVVMADVVVTLPENVREGDEGAFFGWTYCFLADRLGSENMLGGFVHRDEVRADGSPVRDHMHAPFTPILDGRFNFKKMCPRTFYQGLHKDLGDYLEQHLGYRPEIELEDGKRARKALSRVDKRDIDAACAEILAPVEKKAGEIVADATERAERPARRGSGTRRGRGRRGKTSLMLPGRSMKSGPKLRKSTVKSRRKWPRLTAWTAKSARKSTFGTRSARTRSRAAAIESVRQAAGRLEEDVEELEAIASIVDQFGYGDALRSAESSMKSLLDAMDSEDELSRSLMASEERLDALRWHCGPRPKARAEECEDDDKGTQTRFGGLGGGHESQGAGA